MKTTLKVLSILVLAVVLAGCATEHVITPGIPASTNSLTGVVTPAVAPVVAYDPNHTVATIASYGNQAAPLVPAPYNGILLGVLGLATVVTGLIAKKKNDDAANAHAAAATLASAMVGNPTVIAQATQNAANNGTAGIVAEKLADVHSPT